MDSRSLIEYAKAEEVEFFDLRFTDLFGAWHHVAVPIGEISEDSLAEGFGFDASSLRG